MILVWKNPDILDELYIYMRSNNIILWKTWSQTNIVPVWSDFKKALYKKWSCSVAENLSNRILTLPNHFSITTTDTKKIIELLNKEKDGI